MTGFLPPENHNFMNISHIAPFSTQETYKYEAVLNYLAENLSNMSPL
ncbi:hypothetical protein [Pontibacter silvestris]